MERSGAAGSALPLKSTGQERPLGFLMAGVSPRRTFDEAYGSFLDLVASQIASAIANAQAYEAERERASALAEWIAPRPRSSPMSVTNSARR